MWPEAVIGLLLTGLAIRLVDDALDREEDEEAGVANLAGRLGGAAAAYAAASLALAALLLPRHGPALFLAAYALGMAGSLTERLPTRLPGWVETAAAAGLLFLLVPAGVALWALLLMGAFQAADWAMDGLMAPGMGPARAAPAVATSRRAAAWGLLALGLTLLAASLAPALTLAGAAAGAVLEAAVKGPGRRSGHA